MSPMLNLNVYTCICITNDDDDDDNNDDDDDDD